MKKRIDESFTIKNGSLQGQNGQIFKIAYIDPNESEGTYEHKDIIKSRYNGKWLNNLRTWGWFLGNDPKNVYQTQIKPCLQYLESVARVGSRKSENEIIAQIDNLIAELESAPDTPEESSNGERTLSKKETLDRLKDFKQQLVNTLSSEEFKRLIEPILKFKRANGHQYSFLNSILILVQDPQAKLVKSRKNWNEMNRNVKPNSPAIKLWVPKGEKKEINKDQVINDFLRLVGKRSKEELNPGEKEELRVRLNQIKAPSFDLMPYFFDYRFTEQMDGKEDLVGDPDAEVPWYDNTGDVTEESSGYVDAATRIILKAGIKITYVDSLGGARGQSCGGEIKLLKDDVKNMGLLNTMIHEFAHEVLHQTYIKKQGQGQSWAAYFVGTESGRAKVEQQAELTAWIVLKFIGYEMPTNINYVGIWGMSEKDGPAVFDSVAYLANDIYKKLQSEYEAGDNDYGFTSANDSQEDLSEEAVSEIKQITGREVAALIGCEDIYDKYDKKPAIAENFNKLYKRICNPINY